MKLSRFSDLWLQKKRILKKKKKNPVSLEEKPVERTGCAVHVRINLSICIKCSSVGRDKQVVIKMICEKQERERG